MATIDQDHVYRALRALRSGTASESALLDLQIVNDVVDDPTFPSSRQGREFALNQILIRLISDQMDHQRCVRDEPLPDPTETRQAALQAIARGSSGNPEHVGWSWLYYHFVRVDLQIRVEDFCAQANIDPRTLRRYQRRAINRLTEHLIAAEQQARAQNPEY